MLEAIGKRQNQYYSSIHARTEVHDRIGGEPAVRDTAAGKKKL